MSNEPIPARLADRIAYRASFLTGMVAALPEFSPRLCRIARPVVARIEANAAKAGGFCDGYDLVADLACAHIASPTFGRELVRCFLRGKNDWVSA